jgi:hypothetical protein
MLVKNILFEIQIFFIGHRSQHLVVDGKVEVDICWYIGAHGKYFSPILFKGNTSV